MSDTEQVFFRCHNCLQMHMTTTSIEKFICTNRKHFLLKTGSDIRFSKEKDSVLKELFPILQEMGMKLIYSKSFYTDEKETSRLSIFAFELKEYTYYVKFEDDYIITCLEAKDRPGDCIQIKHVYYLELFYLKPPPFQKVNELLFTEEIPLYIPIFLDDKNNDFINPYSDGLLIIDCFELSYIKILKLWFKYNNIKNNLSEDKIHDVFIKKINQLFALDYKYLELDSKYYPYKSDTLFFIKNVLKANISNSEKYRLIKETLNLGSND